MTSEAENELRIAKHYIDTIPNDALSKVDKQGHYPILSKVEAATKHLQRARQLDPQCSITDIDEKSQERKTISLDNLCARALYYEGVSLALLSDDNANIRKGIAALEQAIAYEDNNAQYHTQLAKAYRRLGNEQKATQHIQSALQIDAGYIPAHELQDNMVTIKPARIEPSFVSKHPILTAWLVIFAAGFIGVIMIIGGNGLGGGIILALAIMIGLAFISPFFGA